MIIYFKVFVIVTVKNWFLNIFFTLILSIQLFEQSFMIFFGKIFNEKLQCIVERLYTKTYFVLMAKNLTQMKHFHKYVKFLTKH